MVEPSIFAETVTPSSFCPAAELITPLSTWSAACVALAMIATANMTTQRIATPARRVLRSLLMNLSFRSVCWPVSLIPLKVSIHVALSRSGRGRARGRGNGSQVGDHCVDLRRLQKILEAGHARVAFVDGLADSLVVIRQGSFVQRRAVGFRAGARGQMAHRASLRQDLAALPLLIGKIGGRFLILILALCAAGQSNKGKQKQKPGNEAEKGALHGRSSARGYTLIPGAM